MLHQVLAEIDLKTLSVAPMMGCTDRHCRYLLRQISPHALLYTEMVVSGALIHGDADRNRRQRPEALRRCAIMAEDAGYQEVNRNVGCPSDRVQYGGIGACLMATPQLVGDCIAAMQSAVSIPVTVKCRIGIDDQDDYESFHAFVETVRAPGCRVFIVHARKAILAGLYGRAGLLPGWHSHPHSGAAARQVSVLTITTPQDKLIPWQ